MQTDTATIVLPADTQCYKINREQSGFYRVRYEDEHNLAALGRHIHKQIPGVEDRWGIQNDLYALVRRGSLALGCLPRLPGPLCSGNRVSSTGQHGGKPDASHAGGAAKPACGHCGPGRALVQPVLERIGYQPAADEPQTTTVLREQLLWQGALWGHEPAMAFGTQQFERLVAGRNVHPISQKRSCRSAPGPRGKVL
jgi:hypothetical protein